MIFLFLNISKAGLGISLNVLRINEVAEGNLGEVKRSLLSAVVRPEGQNCEAILSNARLSSSTAGLTLLPFRPINVINSHFPFRICIII